MGVALNLDVAQISETLMIEQVCSGCRPALSTGRPTNVVAPVRSAHARFELCPIPGFVRCSSRRRARAELSTNAGAPGVVLLGVQRSSGSAWLRSTLRQAPTQRAVQLRAVFPSRCARIRRPRAGESLLDRIQEALQCLLFVFAEPDFALDAADLLQLSPQLILGQSSLVGGPSISEQFALA